MHLYGVLQCITCLCIRRVDLYSGSLACGYWTRFGSGRRWGWWVKSCASAGTPLRPLGSLRCGSRKPSLRWPSLKTSKTSWPLQDRSRTRSPSHGPPRLAIKVPCPVAGAWLNHLTFDKMPSPPLWTGRPVRWRTMNVYRFQATSNVFKWPKLEVVCTVKLLFCCWCDAG